MLQFAFLLNVLLLLPVILFAQSNPQFDEFFIDKTMRIDYFHIGDAKEEFITIDRIYQQGIWAGSLNNLIDPFNQGAYAIKVYDSQSSQLIYSKGFSSYFGEYKTTTPASNGVKRTYHESALIPYPRQKINFTVEVRDRENRLNQIFSQEINPDDVMIIKESPILGVEVFKILQNGDPHEKVDFTFIAEGYTLYERSKFKKDIEKFAGVFLEQEPYKSLKERFNIYAVFKPSQESGCDEPTHGSFKSTPLNATFNSMGSERYLLTEDNKSLQDIAAHVPFDALVIMVNTKRYGCGGIYNFFCTATSDNQWNEYVFIHEIGHSFAGLADEYYTSSVAYSEFYPKGIEPLEANITALLKHGTLKWEKLVDQNIEIPTLWEKEEFDKMDLAYQKIRTELNEKVARLNRENAPADQIKAAEEESERLSRDHAEKMDNYLKKSKYFGKVGAYEGAGYSSQGLYRPMLDCIMFSKGKKPYCKVCEKAIIKVIDYYTK
jgi:hypothetical protein